MPNSTNTIPAHVQLQQFGERLKAFRLSRNMSQKELAEAAGISRRTVTQIETTGNGTIETLLRVLKAMELSDRLSDLVPDASIDPFNPDSMKGPTRQRASSHTAKEKKSDDASWSWGDT